MNNKERVKIINKKSWNKHKDKRIKEVLEWRENNKEKYNQKHSIYMRKWRKKKYEELGCDYGDFMEKDNHEAKNKRRMRNINRNNMKRALEYYNNGKSDKLPTKSPSRMLLKLYEIQNHNCPYCSNNMKDDIHIDHIIPLSKNGSNEVHNLILCCSSCNLSKNAKELDVWLEKCGINYEDFVDMVIKRNNKLFDID